MMTLLRTGLLLLLPLPLGAAYAEGITVAVASNFRAPMQELAREFEATTAHQVAMSYGSSGKFFAQIQHGAPFMVFFSADTGKPQALEKAGLAVPGTRFTYAVGALALWSRKAGFVDNDASRLKSGRFNKLALANPRLAPYGVAAVEVLERLQLKEATRAKWLQGENIAQTFQFVRTGNADMGFVALSQIVEDRQYRAGSAWVVPGSLYEPIRQDAVLLKGAEGSDGARALLHFVQSEKGRAIIETYGYTTPLPASPTMTERRP